MKKLFNLPFLLLLLLSALLVKSSINADSFFDEISLKPAYKHKIKDDGKQGVTKKNKEKDIPTPSNIANTPSVQKVQFSFYESYLGEQLPNCALRYKGYIFHELLAQRIHEDEFYNCSPKANMKIDASIDSTLYSNTTSLLAAYNQIIQKVHYVELFDSLTLVSHSPILISEIRKEYPDWSFKNCEFHFWLNRYKETTIHVVHDLLLDIQQQYAILRNNDNMIL